MRRKETFQNTLLDEWSDTFTKKTYIFFIQSVEPTSHMKQRENKVICKRDHDLVNNR